MLKLQSTIRTLIILGALAVWRLFGVTPAAYVFDIGLLIIGIATFFDALRKKSHINMVLPCILIILSIIALAKRFI